MSLLFRICADLDNLVSRSFRELVKVVENVVRKPLCRNQDVIRSHLSFEPITRCYTRKTDDFADVECQWVDGLYSRWSRVQSMLILPSVTECISFCVLN